MIKWITIKCTVSILRPFAWCARFRLWQGYHCQNQLSQQRRYIFKHEKEKETICGKRRSVSVCWHLSSLFRFFFSCCGPQPQPHWAAAYCVRYCDAFWYACRCAYVKVTVPHRHSFTGQREMDKICKVFFTHIKREQHWNWELGLRLVRARRLPILWVSKWGDEMARVLFADAVIWTRLLKSCCQLIIEL